MTTDALAVDSTGKPADPGSIGEHAIAFGLVLKERAVLVLTLAQRLQLGDGHGRTSAGPSADD